MFEQDYIMRQIHFLAKMVAKFLFGIDSPTLTEELEDRLSENETGILKTLIQMIDSGEIGKAEDILFDMLENNEKGCVETALLFYTYLENKSDEFLILSGFSREEVNEGFRDAVKLFGAEELLTE